MKADALTDQILDQIRRSDPGQALDFLDAQGLADPQVAAYLADQALEQAELDPATAAHWLDVAEALFHQLGQKKPLVQARIHYARARLALIGGLPEQAETQIHLARACWREAGDQASLARSALGLTQVLTLQGRYAEAETAIREALEHLPPHTPLRAQALVNLANLLRRREQHAQALDLYRQAEAIYRHAQAAASAEQAEALRRKIAYVAVNQANALMALDRPLEAEKALRNALAVLEESQDRLNLGRTWTNLGTLYLRTGRYAQALKAFQQAATILLVDDPIEPDGPERQADVLLLEQANAYLALNLIPEAIHTLQRAIHLFRQAGQPYELGQSLYTLALIQMRRGHLDTAQTLLHQAQEIFQRLASPHWRYRVDLALATLAYHQGDLAQAEARLAGLPTVDANLPGWDLPLRVEASRLHVQICLTTGRLEEARRWSEERLSHLEQQIAEQDVHMPHLAMTLAHAWGSVALATQEPRKALHAFRQAVDLLESIHVHLPMEEARAAYLDDKESYYGGWALALLAQVPVGEPLAGSIVADVFAVAERARARSLLERIHAAGEMPPDLSHQGDALRGELHWLYNQLLTPADPQTQAARRERIHALEATLGRLAWQKDILQAQIRPITLARFQAGLDPGEQAVVYYWLTSPVDPRDRELLAFVVSRDDARLIRGLIRESELEDLVAALRFQMGRVEVGGAYVARRRERLLRGVQAVLAALHERLWAPLAPELTAPRLLIVPHGPLHRIPFHALWNGCRYLVEQVVCRYAPSPGVALHLRQAPGLDLPPAQIRWAGLAPDDPSIPGAQVEVERAAAHFTHARLFLGPRADEAGLVEAGTWAHVLHLATHGLFRPDNPFFSALKLADGWLDVRRIYRLPLQSRLVVLSACESGAAQVRGGDEVIGLVRGFLGAGARSLVVSLWNVHDHGAVDLMDEFYRVLSDGRSPAVALAHAQRMAAHGEQHPYFWAPFMAIE